MRKLWILLFLSIGIVSGSLAQKILDYTDDGNIYRDINYESLFNGSPLYMDLFLPENVSPQMPFAILVHGGTFSNGSREDMEVLAKDLMKANIPCAIIDYKLLSRKLFKDPKDPTYKEMVLNLWHAIQYVQFRSKDWNVRSSGYVLIGQESGAYLSLLAGYKFKEDIQKIIAISPITDLREIKRLSGLRSNFSSTRSLFAKLMGNVPYHDERYLPVEYIDGNPIDQIKNVPTLLIHGTEDLMVPFSQSEKMFIMLQEKNVNGELVRVVGGKSWLLQDLDFNAEVTKTIIKWID